MIAVIRPAYFSAEKYLAWPRLGVLQDFDHTLFVSEAKASDLSLENHVPQAVGEMYACAKQLGSAACSFHFPLINDNFMVEKTLFVEL